MKLLILLLLMTIIIAFSLFATPSPRGDVEAIES